MTLGLRILYNPIVELNNEFCLNSIVWRFYDTTLIVTEKCIILRHWGSQVVLFEYGSFDDLLSIQ